MLNITQVELKDKIEPNTLILGDCLEVMKYIPDNSVDFIVTDPPYGVSSYYWDKIIPLDKMWSELNRIIKHLGVIAIFGSEPFISEVIVANRKMFKYCWYWEKQNGANFSQTSYQPLRVIEEIAIFSDGAMTFTNNNGNNLVFYPQKTKLEKPYIRDHRNSTSDSWEKTKSGTSFLRKQKYEIREYTHSHPRNLLYIASDKEKIHPTQKPVSLIEYFIKTYSKEGEIVLDFTMGVGTTGIACVNTKRKFIGIDIEKEYFDIAVNRITNQENLSVPIELFE